MRALSDIRNEHGFTQEQMAGRLEIAISTYNQYEKGGRNVPKEVAEKVSCLFNVPIEEIFLPVKFTVSKV